MRISLLQWTGQYEALANKAVSKRSGQPRNAKRDSRSVLTDRERKCQRYRCVVVVRDCVGHGKQRAEPSDELGRQDLL